MRAVVELLVAGLMLVGPSAWAQASEIKRKVQDPERLAPFGLMLDAGIPEGSGLSAALRPSRHLRLHVGATHNGLRLGGRAGVTLLPLRGGYTPSVSLEVGHALAVDVEKLSRRMADSAQPPMHSMDRVGYSYASAHLGFEFGRSQRYMFFVRGGMSWVRLDVPNVEALEEPFLGNLGAEGAKGGRFLYTMPSAKLGIVVYFG